MKKYHIWFIHSLVFPWSLVLKLGALLLLSCLHWCLERYLPTFLLVRMLFFPPRPENKLNGQIVLVFYLRKFLVNVSCSPYSQFIISKEDTLGSDPQGCLNHICSDSLGSEPEGPAPRRDHGALSFPTIQSPFKALSPFLLVFHFSVENWPSSQFFFTSGNCLISPIMRKSRVEKAQVHLSTASVYTSP